MTPEQQRIAIAEACGVYDRWVIVKRRLFYRPNGNGYTNNIAEAWIVTEAEANKHVYPHDEPVTKQRAPLPDYLNDLNAMHEAERTLNINELSRYADELDKVCVEVHICPLTHWSAVTCATAAQRAEAFLKAKGLWNGTKA